MDREETRTHRKRVPKKFGTRFCFNKSQEPEPGKSGSPAKSGGAVLRITILLASSLQKVIPRQGRKVMCKRAKSKLV